MLGCRASTSTHGYVKKTDICFGTRPETCPVRALERWLARVGEGEGPLFRVMHGQVIDNERMSTRAISHAVQRAVATAGLRSTEPGFSSHSFRKGFITTADARGKSDSAIAAHCRYACLFARSIHHARPRPASEQHRRGHALGGA